jgi:hypothetical protein
MKNKLWLIALLAIIGFSFAACSSGDDGVTTVPVTKVTLNQKSISLTVGGTANLTATVTPDNATNKAVSWKSDDTAKATVSNNGVVTAVAEGATIITVTTADGNKTDTCSITITATTASLDRITAVYAGVEAIFPDTTLHTLKDGLTVKAHYSDNTETTLEMEDYELSGTLTVGSSIITVSYQGKTTTITVTVNAPHSHIWGDWETITQATCSEDGEQVRHCTANPPHSETRAIAINPNAHDWGDWIETTPASYIADGIERRTCNHDSSHFETRPIPQIPLIIEYNMDYTLALVLNSLPDNDPANPYKIKLIQSEIHFSSSGGNMDEILSSTKYVSLDISDSSFCSDNVSYGAFQNCTSLTSVTLNNCSFGGSGTFRGCTGLTSVTIGNDVTSIVGSTFWGCTSLTSVTIGNDVTSILGSAFRECTSLTNITIPNNVTNFGGIVFTGCSSLTSVTFATGSNIPDANFGDRVFPEGSTGEGGNTLKTAYNAASPKAGTYTRVANGSTWSKQP